MGITPYRDWYIKPSVSANTVNNNFVMSQDIINLQHSLSNTILRSHDFTFTVDNENYQEVVIHDERVGGIDEVLELIFHIKFLHFCHNLLY